MDRLGPAVRVGQLRRGVDPETLIDMLMGTVLMPLLFSADIPTDSEAASIVDQVLQGVRTRPRR